MTSSCFSLRVPFTLSLENLCELLRFLKCFFGFLCRPSFLISWCSYPNKMYATITKVNYLFNKLVWRMPAEVRQVFNLISIIPCFFCLGMPNSNFIYSYLLKWVWSVTLQPVIRFDKLKIFSVLTLEIY